MLTYFQLSVNSFFLRECSKSVNFAQAFIMGAWFVAENLRYFCIKMELRIPNGSSGYQTGGSVTKSIEVESIAEGEEEARELVRRNRLANPETPSLRYRVELWNKSEDKCIWAHDETAGDSILEPTEKTASICRT